MATGKDSDGKRDDRHIARSSWVATWERVMDFAEQAASPLHPRALRVGRWTFRALRWRESLARATASAQTLRQRAQSSLDLLFAVAPLTRRNSNDAATGWQPPVAAKARIVVNPTSGSLRGTDALTDLRETAEWLTERGLATEVSLTTRPGHAVDLTREAVASGMEMVIAAGGDGTLNDVVQGLAGTTATLGVLPLGTVNVWAREMGIPLSAKEARRILLDGERRRVDLGRAGPRYFLMMAGIGFDAEVVKRVERSRLKEFGLKMLDYVATAGALGLTSQPARLKLHIAGRRRAMKALMVVVGNTRLYGGTMQFTQHAVADDGLLDVVVISDGGLLHRLNVFGRAALRRPSLGPRVRYERCRSVRLESDPPLAVQVDGDIIGSLPMTFTSVPSALTVLVPHHAPAPLFSRPA